MASSKEIAEAVTKLRRRAEAAEEQLRQIAALAKPYEGRSAPDASGCTLRSERALDEIYRLAKGEACHDLR